MVKTYIKQTSSLAYGKSRKVNTLLRTKTKTSLDSQYLLGFQKGGGIAEVKVANFTGLGRVDQRLFPAINSAN